MYANEALYNVCRSKLAVSQPTLLNANRLIAQVSSSITSSLRSQEFGGALCPTLLPEFTQNLVSSFPLVRNSFRYSGSISSDSLLDSLLRPTCQQGGT